MLSMQWPTRSLSRKPSQAEIDQVELAGAELTRCILRGLDFSGRDLSGARLVEALVLDCNLQGANLTGADLTDVELDGSDLTGADLTGARLVRARGERVLLTDARLARADLSGVLFPEVVLVRADLTGSNLEQAKLPGAQARGAVLRGARGENVQLDEADLEEADLREAHLPAAQLEHVRGRGLRLEGACLQRARLDEADLRQARLDETDLRKAVLHRARVDDAHLVNTLVSGLNAVGLHGATEDQLSFLEQGGATTEGLFQRLFGRWWSRPTPPRSSPGSLAFDEEVPATDPGFDESPVVEQELEEVNEDLVEEITEEVEAAPEPDGSQATSEVVPRVSKRSRLADLLRRRGAGELPQDLGPGADLSGRDLRRLKLSRLDLTGANLTGARLDGADLARTCLAGARLDRARLARARLNGTDLSDATAGSAVFDDADLTGANLSSLLARGASFVGADFAGVQLQGADLSRADLSAASLVDVDLVDADLSGTLLEQTDLAGARLDDAQFIGAEIDGALGLSSAQLDTLEGRGALVSRFSLNRMTSKIGARQVGRAIGVGLVAMIGGYLALHFLSEDNITTAELEGRAQQEAAEGDVEAARSRYTALIERADKPVDRVYYRLELASLLARAERHDEAIVLLQDALKDSAGEQDLEWETRLRLADTFRLGGKIEQEIEVLENLRDSDGVPPRVLGKALVGLSDAWRRMGFEGKALKTQEEVRERFSNNPEVILAVNQAMADTYQARGETEKALEALRSIEGFSLDDGQQASLMASKGQLLSEMGDDVAAKKAYEALLNRYPDYDAIDGDVLLDIARLALKGGDRAEASRLLDRLLGGVASPGVMARARLSKARMLVEDGLMDEARSLYTTVLEDYPNDDDAIETARRGLSEVLFATQGEESADAMVDELLASGDRVLAAQAMLGRAQGLQNRGDVAGSRTLYEEVLEKFPEDPGVQSTARTQLASLLVAEGRYPEAINAWRDLIAVSVGGDAKRVLESNLGDTWLQSGRLDEAETQYRSILSTWGDDTESAAMARIGLARVEAARGNPERARILWQKVVNTIDDPLLAGAALEELAGSYVESGRDREAMLAYQGFLSNLPEGHDAAFSTSLAIGGILVRLGEMERALSTFETLLAGASQPSRVAEVQLSLGELRAAMGDPAGSAAAWRSVLALTGLPSTTHADAALGLARSHLEQGEPTEALLLAETWEARTEEPAQQVQLMQVQAQALKALGRNDEASRLSRQMLVTAGDDVDAAFTARLELAAEHVQVGEFEQAIALYSVLGSEARDRPTQAAMALSEAQVTAQSGDLGNARSQYEGIAREWPELSETVFEVRMGLAWLSRLEGDTDQAIEIYAGLKGPDPGSEIWRMEQIAQTLVESGRDSDAEASWKRLLNRYSGNRDAEIAGFNGLAALYHSRDELDAAHNLYERVAKKAQEPSQRDWARLNAATVRFERGEQEDAFFELDAIQKTTADPEVRLQAALVMSSIFLELGRPDQALDLLEEMDPSPLGPAYVASFTQRRVEALLAKGQLAEAAEAWEGVLVAFGDSDDAASPARIGLADLAVQSGQSDRALALFDEAFGSTGDRFYQAWSLLGKADALAGSGRTGEAVVLYERIEEDYSDQGSMVDAARQARSGI